MNRTRSSAVRNCRTGVGPDFREGGLEGSFRFDGNYMTGHVENESFNGRA